MLKNSGLHFILAASMCWGCATVTPRSEVRIVDIHPLYYGPSAGTYVGGMMDARVRLQPSDDGRMHVGVFEEYANTTGEMWRASVWLATFQSMMAVYMPTRPWRLSVEVLKAGETQTDGPSAGGLIAAALLAAQKNVPVRQSFTMTGTVNPDGSIGPVGGIVLKFEGAVKGGKTILGYPLSQRVQEDPRTGHKVDLVKRFQRKGVQVVEIRDVYDAYHHMTGQMIRRPKPLTAARMIPHKTVAAALKRLAKDWLTRTEALLKTWKELPLSKAAAKRRAQLVAQISQGNRAATALLNRGRSAGGFLQAAATHGFAQANLVKDQVMSYIDREQYDRGLRVFNRLARRVKRALTATMAKFKVASPRTVSELLTLVDAYEALVNAYGAYGEAVESHREASTALEGIRDQLRRGATKPNPKLIARIQKTITKPLSTLANAEVRLLLAQHNLSFRGKTKRQIRFANADLERLQKFLSGASRALLHYFQTTTVAPYWRSHAVPLSPSGGCRLPTPSVFPDSRYLHARNLGDYTESAVELLSGEQKLNRTIMRMAGGFSRYMDAASLSTIHYSLKMFRKGAITRPKRQEAFDAMLKMAERKAREHAAGALGATGEIPVPAQVAYRIARVYDRSPAPYYRMYALENFWRSSMFSQLAVAFSQRRTK